MMLKIGYSLVMVMLVSIGILLVLSVLPRVTSFEYTEISGYVIFSFAMLYTLTSFAAPIFIGIGKRRVIFGIVASLFQIFGVIAILLVKPLQVEQSDTPESKKDFS